MPARLKARAWRNPPSCSDRLSQNRSLPNKPWPSSSPLFVRWRVRRKKVARLLRRRNAVRNGKDGRARETRARNSGGDTVVVRLIVGLGAVLEPLEHPPQLEDLGFEL